MKSVAFQLTHEIGVVLEEMLGLFGINAQRSVQFADKFQLGFLIEPRPRLGGFPDRDCAFRYEPCQSRLLVVSYCHH